MLPSPSVSRHLTAVEVLVCEAVIQEAMPEDCECPGERPSKERLNSHQVGVEATHHILNHVGNPRKNTTMNLTVKLGCAAADDRVQGVCVVEW